MGSDNMLIYLIYAPLNILLMLLCYLTNSIVVLFADERGELHGFLKYWQTWDDSLDPAFFREEESAEISTLPVTADMASRSIPSEERS